MCEDEQLVACHPKINPDCICSLACPAGPYQQKCQPVQDVISSAKLHALVQRIVLLHELAKDKLLLACPDQQLQILYLERLEVRMIALEGEHRTDKSKLLVRILLQILHKARQLLWVVAVNQVAHLVRTYARKQL